jgi:hypothetical protein
MTGGNKMERKSSGGQIETKGFFRDSSIHYWNNVMGGSSVRGQIEKVIRIYGKKDRIVWSARTKLNFIRVEGKPGMIQWKSLDTGGLASLDIDQMESAAVETNVQSNQKAIIFRKPGRMTKGKDPVPRWEFWRFSPLKPKKG